MESDAMTYEECLRGTFLDPESWLIVIVGLALALVLRRLSLPRLAGALAFVSLLCGAAWSYIGYELNCIELFEG